MKKLTMTVAVLVTVIGTAFATGNGSKKVRTNVIPSSSSVFKVIYANEEQAVVKIRVKDEAGHLIHTDRIKSVGGFMKPYNLSNLEAGAYSLEITDQYGTVKEEVLVKAPVNDAMKLISLSNNKVRLIVEESPNTPFTLSIFSLDGELVHREKFTETKSFSRIYDLSRFENNTFTFHLSDDKTTQIVSVK